MGGSHYLDVSNFSSGWRYALFLKSRIKKQTPGNHHHWAQNNTAQLCRMKVEFHLARYTKCKYFGFTHNFPMHLAKGYRTSNPNLPCSEHLPDAAKFVWKVKEYSGNPRAETFNGLGTLSLPRKPAAAFWAHGGDGVMGGILRAAAELVVTFLSTGLLFPKSSLLFHSATGPIRKQDVAFQEKITEANIPWKTDRSGNWI